MQKEIKETQSILEKFDLIMIGLDPNISKRIHTQLIVTQFKKAQLKFKTESIAFIDCHSLLVYLKHNLPSFNHDYDQVGLCAVMTFDQPIDAIRVYLKDLKMNLKLVGGEEGFPICIPSANLIKQVMAI
jgi:hypothetical protein